MTMRRTLIALPLIFSAGAALAAGNAVVTDSRANVILIAVAQVHVPDALPGLCQVSGTINEVLDGKAFHKGQAISLPVPCGRQGLRPLNPAAGETPLADPQVLQKSRQGIAHLSNAGTLIWGATPKRYGTFGPVSGYRVYDGVMLPVKQASR
jgi:hypothetical protein